MLRPMLHFLLIGALLFGVARALSPSAEAAEPRGRISVDEATLERLRREAIAQTGRPPGSAELEARVESWVDEEVLYREALRVGIDRVDPVVRARLVRNMRFLADAGDRRDDEMLYREALELGMDRSDIVVRRRLVQQMRFLLEAAAPPIEPSDEDLRAYVASRPERYRIPQRVRLTHVYLSRDRRGASIAADAERVLARLASEGIDTEAGPALADPFLHPAHLGLQSEAQLARQLGAKFASAVMGLETGSWQGPVESAYGLHLVWVHERQDAREPELDSVRRAALSAMQAERNAEVLQAQLEGLRARYAVEVPELGEQRS